MFLFGLVGIIVARMADYIKWLIIKTNTKKKTGYAFLFDHTPSLVIRILNLKIIKNVFKLKNIKCVSMRGTGYSSTTNPAVK